MTINIKISNDPDKATELQDNEEIVTAGQILRDARIALGITVQQVSDKINLRLSVINNIEQNVEDKHISAAFMRGYIRCYARYLRIPEDEVLHAYGCQHADCTEQTELQSFSRRTKLEANDNRLMLVSYIIIGVMLVLFLVWGLQRNDVAVVMPEQGSTQPVVSSVIAPEIVSDLNKTGNAITDDQINTPSLPIPTVPVSSEIISVTEHSEPVVETPITAKAEPLVVNNQVVLAFTGDCWVQIKDQNGKILESGVKTAGQTIRLQGLPPLSIKLGAPEQVKLTYAGKNVDLSAFKQGRVAKFNLPFQA